MSPRTAAPADAAAAPAGPPAPAVLTALADPNRTASSHRLAWLASTAEDGVPVGSAFLRVVTAPGQDHLAELELTVHPAHRREGTGTRLLTAALEAAREHRRRSVVAQVPTGSEADGFFAASGFRPVLRLTYTRLALADADLPAITGLAGVPHPGYRLVHWEGRVPDELMDTFVASRRAMDDMPMEDTDYGRVIWNAARVESAARAVADRGDLLHTVAAVHENDGSLVGFTELVVPAGGTGDAQHYGTAVLPEHRGHGLGLWLKAESLRLAHARHPRLTGLLTDMADSNTYMRAINDRLGYAVTHRSVEYQLDLGGGAA